MAQRGFAAVFRTIFRARQEDPEPQPPAAPPDSLSSQSDYETDASSYEEEIQPQHPSNRNPSASRPVNPSSDLPPRPARTSVSPEIAEDKNVRKETRKAQRGREGQRAEPPQGSIDLNPALAENQPATGGPSLGLPNQDIQGQDETPSSQYSLRPRRRRKPLGAGLEIEPAGAETSYPAQPPASPLPPPGAGLNAAKISVRPSRAAMLADGSGPVEGNKAPHAFRGPLMPAPSAGTTSGIAGRPRLVAVGDLKGASLDMLRDLCKNLGLSPAGGMEELQSRIERKLAERQVLNEDTQMLDSQGNPHVGLVDGGNGQGKARSPSQGKSGVTTTTKSLPPMNDGWDSGKEGGVTAKGKGAAPCFGKSMDGGIVAKSSSVKGGMSVGSQFGKSGVPRVDIPSKEISSMGEKGMSKEMGSMAHGNVPDTPTGAVFRVPPYPSGSAKARGRQTNAGGASKADGNPLESVDARGGGLGSFDKIIAQDILRDVFADGQRRLSVKEFQACVKALEAKVSTPDNTRNTDAANLLASKGFPGISAKSSGGVTAKKTFAEPADVGPTKFNTAGGKVSADHDKAEVSAAHRIGIPPAPPNTPGLNNFPAESGPDGVQYTAQASKLLHEAAVQVKGLSGTGRYGKQTSGPPANQMPKVAVEGQVPDLMDTEGHETDITSERNVNTSGIGGPQVTGPVEGKRPAATARGPTGAEARRRSSSTPHAFQQRGTLGSTTDSNPLRGVFAGAMGGPDKHNTTPRSIEQKSIGEKANAQHQMNMDVRTPAAPGEQPDEVMASATKVPVGRTGVFATPREVVKAYSQLPMGSNPTDPNKEDQDQQRLVETAPQNRERAADDMSTPDTIPSHLRGFTSAGLFSNTRAPTPSMDEMDHSGRVIGPSSFRRRRPMSTTSGVLSDLRRSSVAYENKFISDKMRQRNSYNGRSSRPAPLSASSLKILAELRRVREENRASGLKRRPTSPVPIPPSMSKRARREGTFTATDQQRQPTPGTPAGPMSAQNSVVRDTKGRVSTGSKLVGTDAKRKRPIAFGIGKKRNRSTPLPKAAVDELKTVINEKNAEKSRKESKQVDKPGFTFGEDWMRKSGQKNHNLMRSDASAGKRPLQPALPLFGKKPTPEKPSTPTKTVRDFRSAASDAGARTERDNLFGLRSSNAVKLGVTPANGEEIERAEGPVKVGSKRKAGESPASPSAKRLFQLNTRPEKPKDDEGEPVTKPKDLSFALPGAGQAPLFAKSPAPVSEFGRAPAVKSSEERERTSGLNQAEPRNSQQTKDGGEDAKTKSVVGAEPGSQQNPTVANASGFNSLPFQPLAKDASGETKEQTATLFSFPGTSSSPFKTSGTAQTSAGGNLFSFGSSQAFGSGSSQKEADAGTGAESTEEGKSAGASEKASVQPEPKGFTFELSKEPTSTGQPGFVFGSGQATDAKEKDSVANPPKAQTVSGEEKAEEPSSAPLQASKAQNGVTLFAQPSGSKPQTQAGPATQTGFKFGEQKEVVPTLPKESGASLPLQSANDAEKDSAKDTSVNPVSAAPLPSNVTAVGQADTTGQKPAESAAPEKDGGLTSKPFVFSTAPSKGPEGSLPLFGSKPTELNGKESEGTAAEKPSGGIFGGNVSGAETTQPSFSFGTNLSTPLFPQTPTKASNQMNTESDQAEPTSQADAQKSADAMNMSTTPPAKRAHLFGDKQPTDGFSFSAKPDPSPSMPFGQPSTNAGFGAFGGTFGTPAAVSQPQSTLFGAPPPKIEKDPSGPFGAPQFAANTFSMKNASKFVFGASTPQSAAINQGGGNAEQRSAGNNANVSFGSGFQQPNTTFGSSQGNSTVPQFGAPSQPSSGALPFGSGMGANPFGSSQPGLSGAPPVFGSSQPGFSTGQAKPAAPTFGAPSQPSPFTGFGSSNNSQTPSAGLGGPFGAPSGLSSGPNQPQFGSTFGSNPSAPSFSFGSTPASSGAAGAFNIGSSTLPGRRPRKLKAKRILR